MSAADTPRLGAGDVNIRLVRLEDETMEDFVLRPSYNAMRVLSQAGGVMKVMQRIVDGDIDAVVSVVTLGLGYGTANSRTPKDLAERVWRTGMSDETGGLGERTLTYLRVLLGGGRLPASEGAPAADGGEGTGPTQAG